MAFLAIIHSKNRVQNDAFHNAPGGDVLTELRAVAESISDNFVFNSSSFRDGRPPPRHHSIHADCNHAARFLRGCTMTFQIRPLWDAMASFLWLSCLALGSTVYAQTPNWPERPIRIVTLYGAGSATDIILRKITPELSIALGQPVIVENRPGASGRMAAYEAAHAAPDGYTFFQGEPSTMVLLPLTDAKLNYDPAKEFVPVVRTSLGYSLVAVPANSSIQKLADFKTLGRPATFGLPGLGGFGHVAAAALGTAIGTEFTMVPYSQGLMAQVVDVAKGNIDTTLTYSSIAQGLIDAGKIRILATTGPTRNPLLPDIPTVLELTGQDAGIAVWTGLFAPTRTPEHIIDRLRTETQKIVLSDAYKNWQKSVGSIPSELLYGAAFEHYLADQRVYFKKIVDKYGLKSE
jgi:tripartite-type tricarboxylate transporter receptor subunit TctC